VWCISFCQTWKLFQSITSSLIRSAAEEERVKDQNIIKITSNVLKEVWWNDKWKEEARSSRAFCSKIGLGLGSCEWGGEGIFRGIVPHVPRCLRWFRPTGSYSSCVVSTDSEVREPVSKCRQELFLRFRKNFTYVKFEFSQRWESGCGFFFCDKIHITPKHCTVSYKTVMWTLQILIHWRTLWCVNDRHVQWPRRLVHWLCRSAGTKSKCLTDLGTDVQVSGSALGR
jgi:hypothetical protein